MRAYQDDLAYIHDVGFSGFATDAAPALLEILRRNGIHGGLIIDLGCGTGVWARELRRARYDVLGVDRSSSMLELAKRKVPHAEFLLGSFWKVKLPPCQAVTCIGECVNYRFEGKGGSKMVRALFRRVYDSLCSGGVFVFDIAEPGQVAPRRDWWEGEDWMVLLDVEEDKESHTLVRRITTFRKAGPHYQRSEETHMLQLYQASEVAAELRRAGFTVRVVRRYGWLRLPPAHAAFIARKP